jgi:serine/threonine-protein kinase
MLGPDGVPRVVDFGIAKAAHRVQTTRDGALKGKVSYMAPEQLRAQGVDRRADIYAAGVVLWELLANEPFVPREAAAAFVAALERVHKPPSQYRADVPRALDDVVMRALARTPSQRFNTAREMADALELAVAPASARRIGEWATHIAGAAFEQSAARVSRVEAGASSTSGVAVSNAPNIEDLSTAVPAPVIDRAGARTEEHAPLDRLASVTDYQAHLTPASGHTRRGALLGFGVVLAVATAWLFWGGAAAKPAAPLSTVPPAAPTSEVAQAFPITAAPTWSSPATASGDSPAAPRASVPLRARAPSPPSTPCKPPYTESNGVRRYKPECL